MVATALAVTLTTPMPAAAEVRAMSPAMRALVEEGMSRSASFRALIARIEHSDLVVYVREEYASMGSLHGSLTFLSSAGGSRYLLIRLSGRLRTRRLSTLAHELQHAVEIAERPDIVDEASLVRAYAQFGQPVGSNASGTRCRVDSDAAVAVGKRVWREAFSARRER
jgi:hypothetical protein